MMFIKNTLLFILAAIVLYFWGSPLSNQSSANRLLFKSIRVPPLLKKIMRPVSFGKKSEMNRMNIAGILFHSISTIPMYIVFPIYLIVYLKNPAMAVKIATSWAGVSCAAILILMPLSFIDIVVSEVYNRLKKRY